MFLVCGEALFDFFLETEDGPAAATYAARAGGSPFNVAIGVRRLGSDSGLLTGLSTDLLGQRLARVLRDEGVSTAYAIPTDRPTTLSLVGLDAEGVPAYQFYKNGSADTGVRPEDLPALGPEVEGVHFGSYSLAAPPTADAFAGLARARSGGFVTLDPNIRTNVEPDMDVWRERLGALYPHVALLKISAEDLELLHPGMKPEIFAEARLADGVRLVVVTDGGEAAHGWTRSGLRASATPPRVRVIDTVGAGDTFQAALIARLIQRPEGALAALDGLDTPALAELLDYAARAAAITCSRRGADLPRAADLLAASQG
ncbi:carbohydrate kinase family protein [Amaricoccus solimangrovi]|uniref:Carbohydrate kinase n=1 Tax=Amaricoccus solimangrovi TaxID=2589815 RepID=A0A501WV24_9RHOB|nr:carbohydrate kinase [Amaricoccus solimangrovi]TPE52250.1 carbohydrate kinase [Amaricoccus solimangrovi]